MRAAFLLTAVALGGCSAELPPAAVPAPSPPLGERPDGRLVPLPARPPGVAAGTETVLAGVRLRLDPVRRRIVAGGASIPVGVGPTRITGDGVNLAYVADTAGGAVLVVRLRPELQVIRRVALAGSPYGLAMDNERDRMYVSLTATNELWQLTGDGRPRRLRRFATPRQPDRVGVDPATGRVYVSGRAERVLQILEPRTAAR